jgi:hypothetical protein
MPQEYHFNDGWQGEANSVGLNLKPTIMETQPHRWRYIPNTTAFEQSEFSRLSGGYRDNAGEFWLLAKLDYCWNYTESFKESRAWHRGLNSGFNGVLWYTSGKYNGLSIHWIRD